MCVWGGGTLIKPERSKHRGTVVARRFPPMIKKLEGEVCDFCSVIGEEPELSRPPTSGEGGGGGGGGGGEVGYREPSVYVSVNVMSSQDQGSRRAAAVEGGRGGLVHR